MVGGVEYHRMVQPHKVLRRHYAEYDLQMSNLLDHVPDTLLAEKDLVIFSRTIHDSAAERLNQMSIPFGLDLDDWWIVPENHIAYAGYKEADVPGWTERSIRNAHFVTCTTPILAEKIKPLNPNVYVIENGIDSEDPIWQPNKIPSKRLRFGFTQGNSHYEDLKSIADSASKCFNDIHFYFKGQLVLCGFYGEDSSWKKLTMEQIYELMLTGNHKGLKQEREYLRELLMLNKPDGSDEPYARQWGVTVDKFGSVYDSFDVSVAPLVKGEFNSCKSELKMLEAAAKDCAIICNHNAPYDLLATDKNSFDLNKKTFREWARILINNPNMIEDSKAQLKEDVKRYDLKTLSIKRNEVYKKYGRKNNNSQSAA